MGWLYTALLTPFLEPGGGVDLAAIPPHLRWLERQGIDGVVPCGTTGEGPSLSFAERQAVIDTVLAHCGELRVIAGTGCAALPETIALSRYALERGAEAAMVLPPFFFKGLSDAGLLAYYRALCDALPPDGRIVLYHIPPVSQIPITTGVLDGLLASHPAQLYGMKDSGRDAAYTALLVERYPDLRIFNGTAALCSQTLAAGAAGSILAVANAFPTEARAVNTAHIDGHGPAAQERLTAIEAAFRPHSSIAALKALLPRIAGLPAAPARVPLTNLTSAESDALWERVAPLLDR